MEFPFSIITGKRKVKTFAMLLLSIANCYLLRAHLPVDCEHSTSFTWPSIEVAWPMIKQENVFHLSPEQLRSVDL
jgi:hypothetical protein